jgi:hypothetical protein
MSDPRGTLSTVRFILNESRNTSAGRLRCRHWSSAPEIFSNSQNIFVTQLCLDRAKIRPRDGATVESELCSLLARQCP